MGMIKQKHPIMQRNTSLALQRELAHIARRSRAAVQLALDAFGTLMVDQAWLPLHPLKGKANRFDIGQGLGSKTISASLKASVWRGEDFVMKKKLSLCMCGLCSGLGADSSCQACGRQEVSSPTGVERRFYWGKLCRRQGPPARRRRNVTVFGPWLWPGPGTSAESSAGYFVAATGLGMSNMSDSTSILQQSRSSSMPKRARHPSQFAVFARSPVWPPIMAAAAP